MFKNTYGCEGQVTFGHIVYQWPGMLPVWLGKGRHGQNFYRTTMIKVSAREGRQGQCINGRSWVEDKNNFKKKVNDTAILSRSPHLWHNKDIYQKTLLKTLKRKGLKRENQWARGRRCRLGKKSGIVILRCRMIKDNWRMIRVLAQCTLYLQCQNNVLWLGIARWWEACRKKQKKTQGEKRAQKMVRKKQQVDNRQTKHLRTRNKV